MGVVASIVFATRNVNKCARQHDYTRGAVAACQSVSSVDGISKTTSSVFSGAMKGAGNFFAKADGAVEGIFKKIGGESGTAALKNMAEATGAGSKIGAVAQSAVNPLLCVASGVRVLRDDDQYAALIEEAGAMGAMFGCEAIMKCARGYVTNGPQANKGLAGKVAKFVENSPKLKGLGEKATEWFKNIGKGNHGNIKQTLVKVGVDALFVAGSILAFNLGHKLGEAISNRKEKQ